MFLNKVNEVQPQLTTPIAGQNKDTFQHKTQLCQLNGLNSQFNSNFNNIVETNEEFNDLTCVITVAEIHNKDVDVQNKHRYCIDL